MKKAALFLLAVLALSFQIFAEDSPPAEDNQPATGKSQEDRDAEEARYALGERLNAIVAKLPRNGGMHLYYMAVIADNSKVFSEEDEKDLDEVGKLLYLSGMYYQELLAAYSPNLSDEEAVTFMKNREKVTEVERIAKALDATTTSFNEKLQKLIDKLPEAARSLKWQVQAMMEHQQSKLDNRPDLSEEEEEKK